MTMADDLKLLRQENRDDHKNIVERLDKINGKVQTNSLAIASIQHIQGDHGKRLDDVEGQAKSLWAKFRKFDKSQAVKWAYVAGAGAVVFGALQGLLVLIKLFFGG